MVARAVRLLVLTIACMVVFPALALAERVKGRVYDVDERHSEVRLEVSGRHRTFHIEDRSLYRVLRRDSLVMIRSEVVRGRYTIVDAEPAVLEGRVQKINRHENEVVIRDLQTHDTHTYLVDPGVAKDLRSGQIISYDVEERGSREVITRWHRR